ncbi:MAG: ABC transporter permease [Gammaproteobacteria bacterium]|nr:ABC transporter permease [Gammaproteobacteria bacterium]
MSAVDSEIPTSVAGPAATAQQKKTPFSYGWLSLPSLFVVWVVLAWKLPSYILPQPWQVVQEGYEWAIKGQLHPHLIDSFVRELIGFGTAVIVALTLGFLGGFFRPFREYLTPLNMLFMSIPPVAWAPLMLIMFGIGWQSIVVVIFISAVNPMIVTIMEGVLQIQGNEVRAARILGARPWQLFMYVYLPASLPYLTAGLRIGFSQAWRALVAAEMIGASSGIGWMVSMGGEVGNTAQVMMGIVLIGLFSWIFERFGFRQLEKRYEVWSHH